MLGRGLWLVSLLLGLLLALTSCGPRALSPQAYQDLVIKALQGGASTEGELPLPGLIPAVKRLFDSLYCAEYNCGLASEMQHIVEAARDEADLVSLYKGRSVTRGSAPLGNLRKSSRRFVAYWTISGVISRRSERDELLGVCKSQWSSP
jgi:hypothetical protein